ncbi:HAMP domain-containing sensor histidine kinase [Actinoplanes sp. NPDC023801]|uniref:sensor histidine kinase n=1 Tax=Actinoplanes sp. NPDC023801 TaxID=3154595 RepID=UPI0033EF9DF9
MRLSFRRAAPDPDQLLVRTVCHELRPPMTMLSGLIRALENEPPEPRRGELTRLAAEHAAYAEAVLGQIAAAARGGTGDRPAAAPLGTFLSSAAKSAPPGLLAVTATRSALHWPVHPWHTRQILINLIGNAVRHSRGPVRLRSAVRARRLRLAVIDQGGPTAVLRAALERRTPPPGDHGVGLWVVRQRLADLGGTVRARALHPSGLAMEVTLPRYRG